MPGSLTTRATTESHSKEIAFPSLLESPQSRYLSWRDDLLSVFHKGRARGVIADLIIHGSYGDFTYTNFSDLEVTVVLEPAIPDEESRRQSLATWIEEDLNSLILQVDPIQHHGAFFVTPEMLGAYDEAELPLSAYGDAWSVAGSSLSFSIARPVRMISHVFRSRLEDTLNSLHLGLGESSNEIRGMYAMKRILSNFFMLPVFYYQSRGVEICKRDALERARADFGGAVADALGAGARLRGSWPLTPGWIGGLRRRLVRQSIPGGILDSAFIRGYRNEEMEKRFGIEFRPVAARALEELREALS